jgi:hypothetical protein
MKPETFDIGQRDSRINAIIQNGFELFSFDGPNRVYFNTIKGHKFYGTVVTLHVSDNGFEFTLSQYKSVQCTVDYVAKKREKQWGAILNIYPEGL